MLGAAHIKPIFGECAVFAGKAITVNMQLFLDPHDNTTICVSTRSPHERNSIIILADNCGGGVICHCGMFRGHCCIVGTPCPAYFDS